MTEGPAITAELYVISEDSITAMTVDDVDALPNDSNQSPSRDEWGDYADDEVEVVWWKLPKTSRAWKPMQEASQQAGLFHFRKTCFLDSGIMTAA